MHQRNMKPEKSKQQRTWECLNLRQQLYVNKLRVQERKRHSANQETMAAVVEKKQAVQVSAKRQWWLLPYFISVCVWARARACIVYVMLSKKL